MTNWPKSMLALACALLPGCASMDPAAQTGHYEVRVDTPMFRYGPAQSFGPDFTLKQGQHVVLMRKDFGYSRVMTDDNQTGYVATEDLMPMAPQKIAAASGRGSGGGNAYPGLPPHWQGRTVKPSDGRGSRFAGPVLPAGALFSPVDLPPLPENEAGGPVKPGQQPKVEFRHPKPKPTFRVNIPTPDSQPAPAPAQPDVAVPAFR
jgi:hypothetical protein